jgi:arabinan endo-1,5-alpha-L-arabinosidase
MKALVTAGLTALAFAGAAQVQTPTQAQPARPATLNSQLTGDLTVHDPVIIREGDTYYVFNTVGRYIGIRTSKDLKTWKDAGGVFKDIPAWAKQAIPGTDGIWAPDISYVDGQYRLYYSVSTFGSNRSAIGLATSPTLGAGAKWTDHGQVVMSTRESDFNAIDPNFVIDGQGKHWLSLGSFWTGIKLFPLDKKTGKVVNGAKPYSIARRPAPAGGPAPVEAPFIIPHRGWNYLIVSYDYCCKGVNSTYYTVVGRSKEITGPYLGKDGSPMMQGGGSILVRADLQEQQRFRGPGHAGAFTDKDGTTYLVYHAYDKQADGKPTLRIAPLRWEAEGWPVAEY